MRILLCGNTAWSMFNFRAGLIERLQSRGFDVHVAAPTDAFSAALVQMGCKVHALYLDNKGSSMRRDARSIRALHALFKKVRPCIVLNYTIKPVIYGSFAAKMLHIPYISVITGLGSAFVSQSLRTRLIELMLRWTQRHAEAVFFLNADDLLQLTENGAVPKQLASTLPSEGVHLGHFKPTPPSPSDRVRFLFAGRLLWEKGVGHYVDAARALKQAGLPVDFHLLGPTGVANSSAISDQQVQDWVSEGVIDYLGSVKDVRPYIQAVDCVVLPSFYREGVPRILLEAAAMSRVVVTTDTPGCRDVVDNGVSGLLCLPDGSDLSSCLERIVLMTPAERARMGSAGRQKAEQEFDEHFVLDVYDKAIDRILAKLPGQQTVPGATH